MKNTIKLFLVGFLALLSCDSNKDRYESYNFYAEVKPPPDKGYYTSEALIIRIVIRADNYKEGINHEVSWTTTDNKNFVLINSEGNTIKKDSIFVIHDVDKEYIYEFISNDKGNHNLKFNFKSSIGHTFTQAIVVCVR